ncbi:hypothetical protein D1872_51600 [compost metagenome]
MTAEEFVRKAVRGNNWITPDIIECGMIGSDAAYELSEGVNLYGLPVYGVTVCRRVDGEYIHDRSVGKYCQSLSEAKDHIKLLQGVFK